MALHITSNKIKAIKARIITTTDINLVGKIIVKSSNSLNNIIPKCQHSINIVQNVANYIENSMKQNRFTEIDVHSASTDLDYARDIMVSGYEQVELISSAWGQFATLISREQTTSNLSKIQNKINYIYKEVINSPAITDTKEALWDYYQVESPNDKEKFGAYLLNSIYESIAKYQSLIKLYSDLARDLLNNSSYIGSVLTALNDEQLRGSIPGLQPRVPIQQQIRNRFL